MAYTGSGAFGGIRFNDPTTAAAYQKGDGYYTTMPGIDPNKPGWGDLVPAGYELVGYKAPKMSGNSRSINRAPIPGTSYAVLRKRSSAPASAPAPAQAPAQQAEQPLYGKQYSYTDPGDKGYFGMKDYQELAAQGASRADLIRYAFSSPKGVGTKVAEQLGIRAFDAPTPSSLSYTDPGDKGFFGMKDFEELSRQGATLQQIKDYASKAKYGVGGEAASILGIRPAGEADFTRAKADSTADAASKRETALINEINTLTTGFETQLQNIATQNQAIRDEQTKRITDLQNVMQAQAQLRDRPTVAGIKTAAGSAGDAMQVARRGVSGTFGRRGMRIQSLNV